MNKYKGFFIAISVAVLTLTTGCGSGDDSSSGDAVTQKVASSQASALVHSDTVDTDNKGGDDDLFKSKGIDQDVIVKLAPSPGQENVDTSTKIEAVFSIPLDPSSVQKNNVKLVYLSSKTNDHVKGVISYNEETKTVTFTPDDPLKPGVYEVEIKSLKPTKAYKEIHIKEIKYRFRVVNITLNQIKVLPEKIELQEGETVRLEAIGTYSDSTEKNITTEVEWHVDNQIATVDNNATLTARKDGVTSLTATKDGIESSIDIIVFSVIHGHRLPPEPDPKINNSTLLGIDSNDNGVRDDVERWIYDRYDNYYPCEQGIKKIVVDGREKLMLTGKEVKQRVMITCSETLTAYHPIVREIAMQFARAAQIVIQEPEKALETINYMHAAVDCNGYFQSSAKYQDEPILIDHYMFSDEFKNIQFNTAMRVRAFSEYNMALSGGVYSSSIDMREDRKSCDFNVTKLLEEK